MEIVGRAIYRKLGIRPRGADRAFVSADCAERGRGFAISLAWDAEAAGA